MKDVMLDIETLDTRPTAVIVQIGACYFDRKTGEIGSEFCMNINVGSCLMYGLTIGQDTVDWWKSKAKRTWISPCSQSLKNALLSFSGFMKDAKYVWSHSTFDIPIIANAYAALEIKMPFHYRMTRDLRTLTHLAGDNMNETTKVRKDNDENAHDALWDCKYQVTYAVACINNLRRLK